MHFEYFQVHQHIDDRKYDNFVHLLIEHIYEIFQVDNEICNRRQRDTKEKFWFSNFDIKNISFTFSLK